VRFLCGRPGCGKESTATLQIDAPSETVSLVDPRISRDGVPLCARHADATTPPIGWTMNDLRSRNRGLSAVPDEGSVPTSTPPRVRPDRPPPSESPAARMSRRQSIAERARQAEPMTGEPTEVVGAAPAAEAATSPDDHKFRSSRPTVAPVVAEGELTAAGGPGEVKGAGTGKNEADAPASRPTRRRDVAEEGGEEEDRFPWHFQYSDDEPEEMQASSPLLSRAFRSSTG
jgi:hypothetical protein